MEIRNLTKGDMTKVIKLHQYAYGFWTDKDITEQDYEDMIPENIIGLFDNDELMSVLTIMKVKQAIRGVLKGMWGISMVGTYPEARMKGYIRSLMQTAFLQMKEQGLSLSMLEPFRESFYTQFGYVPAHDKFRITAPLDGLRIASAAVIGEGWKFKRVAGSDAKEDYLAFIQDHAPTKYHGYAFNPNIRDEEWKQRNKNRLYVFVRRQGKVEALARYQIKGYMHFEEPGQLIIEEMYWRNLESQAALFNFLGKHRDQVKQLQIRAPYGIDFQHWFMDLKDWIEIKVWHPWMVRIIDIKEALNGLPAPREGELTLKITDPQCGWNNGIYLLQSVSGILNVTTTKRVPRIETTTHGISALVYGTHSLEAIEYARWIKGLNKQIREILKEWFPQLSLYNPYTY
ncbi:MAG: enhanced intracellular survival protein Eis [Promethearchaeota archaeon]